MLRPIVNKIRCKFCGDIIESFSVHDFKRCRCGRCSTDGGQEYAQRSFITENPEDTYEDLSIYYNDETKEFIPAANAKKEDVLLKPSKVEVEEVPVVVPKKDGTHEIKEIPAIPVTPEVTEAEAEPEKDIPYETTIPEVKETKPGPKPFKKFETKKN